MKVTIIGAGISGLLSAYYLVKAGYEVEVFERSDRPGGLIQTMASEYGPLDYAASSLVNSKDFEELFFDIGLELAEKGPLARIKKIYRGSLRRWPLNLLESAHLAAGVLFLTFSNNKGLSEGRTLKDWGENRLGKSGYHYLLETFFQGIYAGDCAKMSASLVLGPLLNNKKRKKRKPSVRGSVMPSGGMGSLIDNLATFLEKQGVKINFSSTFNSKNVTPYNPTIIATSAIAAGNILYDLGIETGKKLQTIDMLDLASIHLVFEQDENLFDGYGCLFPVSEGFNCLGVLASQNGFPNEYSHPCERWIIGGAHKRDILSLSDERLIELALGDRKKLTKKEATPIAAYILRRRQSLPHYTPELEQMLKSIKLPGNLHLIGNYLGGIGLTAIIKQSQSLVSSIQSTDL